MAEQVKNSLDNPTSTLAAGITSGALSLTVASGHGARLPATGDFRLKLTDQSDDTLYELVVGTARSSDVVTITRAAEGTTARAFVTGDHVDLVLSAAALVAYVAENSAADADVTASTAASVILAPAASARNVIQPTAGTVIDAIFKAHAAQSVDLTQWQTSAAAVLGKIGPTGCWTIQPSALGLTGAVLIDAGTPPLVGPNEPQRATLNLKATPSLATDGYMYGVRFGSYDDSNFEHTNLGKYDWLFDSFYDAGDSYPYLTMYSRRASDRKAIVYTSMNPGYILGSTFPTGDAEVPVGFWYLGGEFGGDGKAGGLKLWDLNDFLIHETLAGGVATFAFQRVAGAWKFGVFGSAPSPVVQQSASDVGALWTALKAYGWLDAGSTAPDLATQAELDAHINDASDAHDASAISILDTAGDFTATEVEGALAELQAADEADEAALAAHVADATAAHAATAVGFTPAGTIAATTVQAAIEEVAAEGGGAASFVGAHITNSADITIPDNVETALTWDTERYDVGGFHEGVTNPSRLTIPEDGKYHVGVGLRMNQPSAPWADLEVLVWLNGVGTGTRIAVGNPLMDGGTSPMTNSFRVNTSTDWDFVAGDFVEVAIYSALETPDDVTVDRQTDSTPEFYIHKIQVGPEGPEGPPGASDAEDVAFTPTGTIAATDVQAAIEEVASEAGGYAFTAGIVYASGWIGSGSGGVVDRMDLTAFPAVYQATTFDRIGIYCNNATATAVVRLGIYNDVGGVPTTLVLDAGTVDCSTTGEKTITISQLLPPGRYWLAAVPQVAVAGSAYDMAARGNYFSSGGVGGTFYHAIKYGGMFGNSSVSGALPSPAAGVIQDGAIRVAMRAA